MTRYQLLPNLTLDEYEALRASIRELGVQVPVEVDDEGNILDGHHRAAIADELGIEYPTIVRAGLTEEQKVRQVLALNLDRRHLTRDQRAELVATLRRRRMSVRAIADATHIPKSTVEDDLARVRDRTPDEHGPGGRYYHPHDQVVGGIIGQDGKSYPATRPPAPRPTRDAEPPADYIDQMPPAEQEWERDFRRRGRWINALHDGAKALLAVAPTTFIPLLDAEERGSTELELDLIESWTKETRKALADTGGLRVVGGSR